MPLSSSASSDPPNGRVPRQPVHGELLICHAQEGVGNAVYDGGVRSQSRDPQESASTRHLLENGETSGIPRLSDDVILAVEFAKHGVMDMLEVFESEIVLEKNR